MASIAWQKQVSSTTWSSTSSISLDAGDSQIMRIYMDASYSSGQVTFTPSSSDITVSRGTISGRSYPVTIKASSNASGTYKVVATTPGASATLTVNVSGSSSSSPVISGPTSITINSLPATWTANGFSDPDQIEWNFTGSGDASGSGNTFTITSISNSNATFRITATQGSSSASISVTVTKVDIPVTSFSVSSSSVSVYEGSSTTVSFTYSPSNATTGTLPSLSSGGSYCSVSVSSKSIRITGSSAGTETLTFSNSDGVSFSVRVTVMAAESSVTEVTSMTVSPTTLNIMEGNSATFKVTVSPSTADDLTISVSNSNTSYISVSKSRSGATTTVTVRGLAYSAGRCRLYVTANGGSISGQYVDVYVTKAPVYVTDFTGLPTSPKYMDTNQSTSFTPKAYPTTADDTSWYYSIISGSSYISVTGTTSLTVVAKAAGTAVMRFYANDANGYYEDVTFIISEKVPVTAIYACSQSSIDTEISSINVSQNKTASFYILVRPTNAYDQSFTISVTGGDGEITIADGTYTWEHIITGVSEGTVYLRISANDGSGVYTDLTVYVTPPINDDYPRDHFRHHIYYVGRKIENEGYVTLSNLISNPCKVHAGNVTSNMVIPGLAVAWSGGSSSSIPPATSPLTKYYFSGLCVEGVPEEPGEWWIYVESDAGVVQGNKIEVIAEGTYVKTLHFDANIPDGCVLHGSVPSDITLKYTKEGLYYIDIPEHSMSVDGYVFVCWREAKDNSLVQMYRTGDEAPISGADVTKTLYAEWFPIPDGATGTGTVDDPFHWTVKSGDELSLTVPNKGDYPVEYRCPQITEMPIGVRVNINGSAYAAFPSSIELTTGVVTITGKAQSGVDWYRFVQMGTRGYQIDFTLTILAGEVPEEGEMLVYSLDAAGGVFIDGSTAVSLEAPDGYYNLPDWSVVDRPGYRLTGWTGTSNGHGDMGSRQITIDTWVAVWEQDIRDYGTEYLPRAAVRIYRDIDEYIDVTRMYVQGGEPKVNISENASDDATMTLIMRYDEPTSNLMSPSCTLWSSGSSGAVETGMYVRIDNIEADGTVSYLMDGFVSTITPDPENGQVSIQVADLKSVLSRSGTTIRRNYYGSRMSDVTFDAIAPAGSSLRADVAAMGDGAVDGSPYWGVDASPMEFSGSSYANVWNNVVGCQSPSFSLNVDSLDAVHGLSIGIAVNAFGRFSLVGHVSVSSSRGTTTATAPWSLSGNADGRTDYTINVDLDSAVPGGTVNVTLVVDSVQLWESVTMYLYFRYGTGTGRIRYQLASQTSPQVIESADVAASIRGFVYSRVLSYSISEGIMSVTAIEGTTIGSSPDVTLYSPPGGRLRVSYTTEDVPTTEIMSGVANAMGITPLVNDSALASSETMLRIFRTGGGYALDYLQKLADVPSSDGRRRSFRVRGYTTPMLVSSARHSLSESPSEAFVYGGDATPAGLTSTYIHAIAPKMTLKDRASLAMVRASGSMADGSSVPIMVAVEDPDSLKRRRGLSIETISADGSVSTMLGAAKSGYSVVTSNDLDQWEGTVTIPGIRTDFIEQYGAYAGSGIPIALYDSRIGLSGYRTRVKQVTVDYNLCTTQVTLVNYGLIHSNSLSSTAAVAISASDYATGMTDTALYDTQYVYVRTDKVQTVKKTGNVVKMKTESDAEISMTDIQILQYPYGNVLVAYGDPADTVDEKYGISKVSVNQGTWIDIPSSSRPDFYTGQVLILNLFFPSG